MSIEIEINGHVHHVEAAPETPLLYAIRNDAGLKGTRFGCGQGSCGACMVMIDGDPVNSCDLPISEVGHRSVRTIEDAPPGSVLHRLQRAFIEEQAAQCGFCTSGILMSACALLETNPEPSREEIAEALDENLCRCGSHWRMIRAVERAATVADHPISVESRVVDAPTAGLGNDHLTIGTDGTVIMRSGKVDIGQGISTAIAQIAADALDVSVDRMRIVRTDTTVSPDEGTTAGSFSVDKGGSAMRAAAESLRARLLALATEDLGSTAEELTVRDGTITSPSGDTITYWQLAGGADTLSLDQVSASSGSVGRFDLPEKLIGKPSFLQDMELPGMLHGRVVRPPTQNGSLVSVDPTSTLELDGVTDVVRSGSFLAVVAEREEQAITAARRLFGAAVWDPGTAPDFDPADPEYLRGCDDVEIQRLENTTPSTSTAVTRASAVYTRGFLAHASIGPSCAIGLFEGGSYTIWTHSQSVFLLRTSIARTLDVPEDAIRVVHREGSGCYGHNGADDVALDAALMARGVPGRPIRVQWSRQDEFAWEPYSSAMVIELGAGLDSDGRIVEWSHRAWSHPHSSRPGNSGGVNLLAAGHIDPPVPKTRLRPIPLPNGGMLRNAIPLYDVGSSDVEGVFIPEGPVRTSALRGLATQPNIFAIESFIEDLAEQVGADPVEFRLNHLADPRARAVIESVVERAGVEVGGRSADGHGHGLGFGRYKNMACYVAVIAEVEAEHEVRLVRAWAVVDAGRAVNPDGIANQIEGGIIQSASWALKEEIKFVDGRPQLESWVDYPILGFAETPELDVVVLDRPDEPSVGVGEGAQGPATAAIANGVRAALGVPVRDLPLTPSRIMNAILD